MSKRVLPLLFLLWAVLVFTPGYAQGYGEGRSSTPDASPRCIGNDSSELAEKVELIRLYSIADGKLRESVYRNSDLASLPGLVVDGYVCGIVVLCRKDICVTIAGQALSKIRRNSDGTFSLKYFGTLKPEELELPGAYQTYYARDDGRTPDGEDFLCGGYSCFPRINGSAISEESEFSLIFASGDRTYSLPIQQAGIQTIRKVSLASSDEARDVVFRYVGNNLERLKKRVRDFDSRLQAITEGIDYVESTFGIDLIEGATIIDFDGPYNAVSCNESNDIWFYVRTFGDEPVEELKTIAAHEALHVLVDKLQVGADSDLREYFANLKGYDAFSYERFILVTTGASLSDKDEAANNIFFSFINEKNFLENRKGGHSQKNVDEFCASFLHSLIFIDRLGRNLDRPIKMSDGRGGVRTLSAKEKATILDNYIRGIEVLLAALPQQKDEGPPLNQTRSFLQSSLKKANDLRQSREQVI